MRLPFKIALVAIAALIGLLLLQSVLPKNVTPTPAVKVSFLGYTNSPPRTTLAVFGITNQAKRSIKLLNGCQIDLEGKPVPLPTTTLFPGAVIRPGGSLIVVIGIPPREARWRAHWGISWNTGWERILSLRDKWQIPVFLGGHVIYSAQSEWLPP